MLCFLCFQCFCYVTILWVLGHRENKSRGTAVSHAYDKPVGRIGWKFFLMILFCGNYVWDLSVCESMVSLFYKGNPKNNPLQPGEWSFFIKGPHCHLWDKISL